MKNILKNGVLMCLASRNYSLKIRCIDKCDKNSILFKNTLKENKYYFTKNFYSGLSA